jgi:hypothetical protein
MLINSKQVIPKLQHEEESRRCSTLEQLTNFTEAGLLLPRADHDAVWFAVGR